MIRYIAFLHLVLLGFVAAQDSGVETVRRNSVNILNEFVLEAVQNNPGIKSAELRWRARRKRGPQVSSLDDPKFNYTRWLSSVETRVGPQKNIFALSQRFPFFGKLSLKGKMADQDALGAREEYRVDPIMFGHFAEACRLTAQNERALSRLVSEISQSRRAVDPKSMIVNVEL